MTEIDRNREGAALESAFDNKSLIGSVFLTFPEGGSHQQGAIVAEPAPGVYLVEYHEWLGGSSLHQELVRIEDMFTWRFYDEFEWQGLDFQNLPDVRRARLAS